jgi:two-component system cell cycle sensor histidine kinase/response regulator CckA
MMSKKLTYEELENKVKELEESEKKYRHLFETSMVGIYRTRISDGKFLAANQTLAELMGYDSVDHFIAEYVTSKHYTDPKRREELLHQIQTQGRVDGFEIEMTRIDGSIVQIAISAAAYPERGYLEGFVIDITKRKQAEAALRQSEVKYRTLTNNLNVGVYRNTAGPKGRFIEANPAIVQLFGYDSREAFFEASVSDLYQNPDDRKKFNKKILQKGALRNETLQLRRKDGTSFTGSVSAVAVKDEDGRIKFFDGIFEDISERINLEAQLQQAHKMESLGTLAGGIAHDFNNLLMGIQGRTSLMLLDTDSQHPFFEHLKGVEDYVKSASDLTKQLLAFARGGKYEVIPADLNEIIQNGSDMFGRTKKEITIHRREQKDIWTVEVDRGQIEQVMLNLYVNAWQSMPGGGELYLETENVMLDDDMVMPYDVDPGKYVKVSVIDTGVGMDKATQKRIFDPFFTTKEMGRGTGLGLASAYGIIKNHDGIIKVASGKGEGTVFSIFLPASEMEVIKDKDSASEILKGHETILLVDDEDIIIDVGKELLRKMGHTVFVAKSGEASIELYEAKWEEIDMVILDMIMPEMGGGEIYEKLREINPDVKVLLSSGYSLDGQATEILEQGCNGFLQKPFNMRELSGKIREILE